MTRSRCAGRAALGLLAWSALPWLAVGGCDDTEAPGPTGASPAAPAPGVEEASAATDGAGALDGAPLPVAGDALPSRDPASAAEPPTQAQPGGSTWLLGQVRDAHSFRARAAAAIALGRRKGARIEAGLIEALRDDHPAVRTAAASALSRFSGAAVEQALKQAQGREPDRTAARALGRAEQTVAAKPALSASTLTPAPAARGGVYLSLSAPRTQGPLDAALLSGADAAARAALRRLPSARLAPPGESAASASAVLSTEGRTGYQLDVTLGLEARADGTRATANVLVASYPGRSILGLTKGAATVTGNPQDPALQRLAIEHAIKSAFSDLPQMFAAHGR